MAAMLMIGVVTMIAGVLAASAIVVSAIGALIWLVLLPFRLVFFILKLGILAVAGGVGLAVLMVTGVVVAATLMLALVAPLLPVALVVGAVWLLLRSSRRPARA